MDYKKINRASWNNKVDIHLSSDFYDQEGFQNGKSSLNTIELELLGNVAHKSVLHLQCHFGQDTISLARMGAHTTGVDLSDRAVQTATQLALKEDADATFICCDLYDLPQHLEGTFDIVFTSYGTIGWLPDMDKWAKVVSHYLNPGGKLVFVEFHPVVWMFDDDFKQVVYPYLNSGPIVETEKGTYADPGADLEQQSVTWNHSIGEVVNSLLQNGLNLSSLDELDYSPYACFRHTEEFAPGKFRIRHLGNRIPMTYAIVAQKKVS
ncbi:MAG: class I SAM-dependent methyltransferase [Bacteroidota bacterium]